MKELLLHFLLFLILYLESTARSSPILNDEPSVCGYKSCPPIKKGFLNVHLIPHTHDDVGWLKTVDQYYFGSKPGIQKAGVQYILDSVVEELLRDKTKRFIYVETAFFWKWWKKQHDIRRHEVKRLVKNGQLEFIGGGWSMNDEAAVHYQSVIDQFTWGFRKLNDSFGECGRPKIGWQIDPFGHSRETASIMARLGFDGLFFGRLDYREKTARLSDKTAEMIWQGSPNNLGRKADLFTGVLFNNYSPPPTFCFDVLCDDEPIIDDKKSPDYNAESRVNEFLRFVKLQSQKYLTKNVIITMGGDFTYQDAHMWYKNMDKLIRVVNEMQVNGSEINLLYSTPSCYLKAVNDEDVTLTVKSDDFFPYASDPHSYWTGYFTSRPTIKYYERKGNNFLQVCKQLYVLTDLGPEDSIDLDALRSAMGVMQHHDAITGTEKQHVAFDYARILSNGIAECEIITDIALSKLMEKQPHAEKPIPKSPGQLLSLSTCPLLNVSQCEVSENYESFVITLYNPLSYPVNKYVRLPVPGSKPDYTILCPMGKPQDSQIVPIPQSVQNIPGRFSQANFELVFKAKHIPPLGFRSFYISKNKNFTNTADSSKSDGSREARKLHQLKDKIKISNDHLSFKINEADGLSKLIVDGEEIPLFQNFYYYKGAVGNNLAFENRSSGAYIFRPNGTNPDQIGTVQRKVYKGPISVEVHETYSDWVSQVIRLYKNESYIEFNWLVGPIPIDDGIGKEIISRFTTNLTTKGTFYTDANGREMLQRIRNYRPTWNLTLEEPISANYYPVTSKISIKDSKIQLSVLTDRAQGGSSINDGQIELMVHRRLLHDDAFGVGEALNETAFGKGLVAVGTHYLTAGNVNTQNAVERLLALEKLLDVWTFLTPAPVTSFDQWKQTYNMEYSGLTEALPPNVHVLTLEPWKGRSILIRLEHVFEVNEDNDLSKPVTVNLEKMFFPFTIASVQETTLGANQLLKDMQRLKWKSESNSVYHGVEDDIQPPTATPPPPTQITLYPMEIKTFIVGVHYQ